MSVRASKLSNASVPSPCDRQRKDALEATPVDKKAERRPTTQLHDDLGRNTVKKEREGAADPETMSEDLLQAHCVKDRRARFDKKVLREVPPTRR